MKEILDTLSSMDGDYLKFTFSFAIYFRAELNFRLLCDVHKNHTRCCTNKFEYRLWVVITEIVFLTVLCGFFFLSLVNPGVSSYT